MSLNTNQCNNSCLVQLLRNGKYFSFLEFYEYDEELDKYYQKLVKHLNIITSKALAKEMIVKPVDNSGDFRVAILIPTQIAKHYANSIYNTILSYLVSKDINYEIKVFDSVDENLQNIQLQINQLKNEGFRYVIAPFRKNVLSVLNSNCNDILVYVPTVATNDINMTFHPNITLGGLDYSDHISLLESKINGEVVLINSLSSKAKEISQNLANQFDIKRSFNLNTRATNLNYMIKTHKKTLNESNIILNIPLIKGSSFISKMKFYDINDTKIYSIQNMYNPAIFNLVQKKNLHNLYITNIISKINYNNITGINQLLNNNIEFNWVNYSTLIGIDYLYSKFNDTTKDFAELIENNQVIYDTKLYQVYKSDFVEVP